MRTKDLTKHFPGPRQLPEDHPLPILDDPPCYLIDGQVRQWHGPARDCFSPVSIRKAGALEPIFLGRTALLDKKTALSALNSAERAFHFGTGAWPSMTVTDRISHVNSFMDKIMPLREKIAQIEMWEIAKSYEECLVEFDRTVEYLTRSLQELQRANTKSARPVHLEGINAYIRRAPLGIALCSGPQNVPVFETLCSSIPAVMMGNTTVIKMPRFGALCLSPFIKLMGECFPPGVINVIDGEGKTVVLPIMRTGKIAVLAFIGSSKVANIIRRAHPKPNRLRKIMGLDAKNPAIVLEDADLDLAVCQCVKGALGFNGQRCTGLKMICVDRKIAKEFVSRLSAEVDRLKIGMPWQAGATITPLTEPARPGFLNDLIQDAISKGAKRINKARGTAGSLMAPVVLYPVTAQMKIAQVEQFGPVVPIMVFDSPQEAIEFVQESDFGQQASLFGQDPKTMGALVDQLIMQVSRVNINSYCSRSPDQLPFTGRKDSAESTLSVCQSINAFSVSTVVASPDDQTALTQRLTENGFSKFLSK